jgi:hypothetical protein
VDSTFGIRVPRRCRVRSGDIADELPFPTDDDGFLAVQVIMPVGPDDELAGRVLSLQEALLGGAVVLLGEPGLGKSTEFDQLRQSAAASGITVDDPIDGADLVDAASFEHFLGRQLRSLPPVAATRARPPCAATPTAPVSIVIVDQLDESPIVSHLAAHLKAALADRDTSGLRLVLGCRTADYPANLTSVLVAACGACHLADLAPLTRVEATELASSVPGTDGDALVAAAVEHGAGALANVPLTLWLLCGTYRRRGSLDTHPAELFADGVLQLLDEHDTQRTTVHNESTAGQRRAVAERIAAQLVLSGRRTIWRGPALQAGDHDVDAGAFVGGEETCDGGAFHVSQKIVAATLATGLFTGRGANRLAFRHASFAAYLAACYLVRHDVPPPQLRQLFLMPFGRADHAIPVALRETAGWLAGMAQNDISWLVEADPESLVPHSPLVDSPAVRSTIVAAMLRRAGEIEIDGRRWARADRHLAHAELGAQLLEILTDADAGTPPDWDSWARIRLAIRLARESDNSTLISRLLDLADSDVWDDSTRVLAAASAFEADPDTVARRLRELLYRLAHFTAAASVDPHGELRGSLLRMLWPEHLAIEDVLPVLRDRSRSTVIGAMRLFWRMFAFQLPEDDLGTGLRWAAGEYARGERTSNLPDFFDQFVDEVVDRALFTEASGEYLDSVAAIVRHRIAEYRPVPMPQALDRVDGDGVEEDGVRDLRRALARTVVQQAIAAGSFDRAVAWQLVGPWREAHPYKHRDAADGGPRFGGRTVLLDAADFTWLYHQATDAAAAGQDEQAEAYAVTAAIVFDLADDESATLALTNLDHPVWRHVSWWFDSVSTDSKLAANWRRTHTNDRPQPTLEDVASLHQQLRQLLNEAGVGEPDAFWRLMHLMQFEPTTAKGRPHEDDNLLNLSGTAALPANHADRLTDAALRYLIVQDDHAAEWVGTGKRDRRAWAGFLAFALLLRRDRLNELPPERWACWTHALIESITSLADQDGVRRQLLEAAAIHAPERLAASVMEYVRADLPRGSSPFGVGTVDPSWAPPLADAFAELADDIAAAVTAVGEATFALDSDEHRAIALETWEMLVAALLAAGDARGLEAAGGALRAEGDEPPGLWLAGRAGRAILRSNVDGGLAAVLATATAHPAVGRQVALTVAQAHDAGPLLARCSIDELVSVFRGSAASSRPTRTRH